MRRAPARVRARAQVQAQVQVQYHHQQQGQQQLPTRPTFGTPAGVPQAQYVGKGRAHGGAGGVVQAHAGAAGAAPGVPAWHGQVAQVPVAPLVWVAPTVPEGAPLPAYDTSGRGRGRGGGGGTGGGGAAKRGGNHTAGRQGKGGSDGARGGGGGSGGGGGGSSGGGGGGWGNSSTGSGRRAHGGGGGRRRGRRGSGSGSGSGSNASASVSASSVGSRSSRGHGDRPFAKSGTRKFDTPVGPVTHPSQRTDAGAVVASVALARCLQDIAPQQSPQQAAVRARAIATLEAVLHEWVCAELGTLLLRVWIAGGGGWRVLAPWARGYGRVAVARGPH